VCPEVRFQLIQVTRVLAASNTDILAGTQLDQIPSSGTFVITGASTQNDGTINVSLGQAILVTAQPLPLRTNGVPDMSDDPSIAVPAMGGARPVIAYAEVTAASVYIIVQFFLPSEL